MLAHSCFIRRSNLHRGAPENTVEKSGGKWTHSSIFLGGEVGGANPRMMNNISLINRKLLFSFMCPSMLRRKLETKIGQKRRHWTSSHRRGDARVHLHPSFIQIALALARVQTKDFLWQVRTPPTVFTHTLCVCVCVFLSSGLAGKRANICRRR